jgi:formate hydrogenlyase transcriptional activator
LVEEFGITAINEDGMTHSCFMVDFGDLAVNRDDLDRVQRLNFSIYDNAFGEVVTSDEPVILDINRLVNAMNASEYLYLWQQIGFRQVLSYALRAGGKTIGAIFFNLKNSSFEMINTSLLKGVCAQLSVAVSNILSNDIVQSQINKINNYKQQLEEEKTYLQEEIAIIHNSTDIIGNSPALRSVFNLIDRVSSSNSTVLILGETGTGKELVARAIHNNSARKSKLMVKVNCAALPVQLIESELFGHEKGSFTGAYDRRVGKFELANNGTLFLDEIGEIPLDLQAKLLRVLQEKEIERIGGKGLIKVNVRIIAATNRNLENEVMEGRFREDLYYRLNIFPLKVPSLRERTQDIPLLANYFIEKFSKQTGKKILGVSNAVMREMVNYNWPGNIRELEHFVERSVLLANGDTITSASLRSPEKPKVDPTISAFKLRTIDDNERELIVNTLNYCAGQISGSLGAARILGIPPTTLHSKMKKLGIEKTYLK